MRTNHQIRFGRPYSNGKSKRRHGRIAHGSNCHLYIAKPFSSVSSTVVIVAIYHGNGNWIMVYVFTLHIRIFIIDSRKSPGIRLITTFNPHDRPRTLLLPAYTRYVDFFWKDYEGDRVTDLYEKIRPTWAWVRCQILWSVWSPRSQQPNIQHPRRLSKAMAGYDTLIHSNRCSTRFSPSGTILRSHRLIDLAGRT